MNSRPTHTKRQKELARKEKQRMKAARKQQRKLDRDVGSTDTTNDVARDINTEISALAPGEEQSS